jgi:branched-chain amino acid transport system substrate-binding protein
MEENESIRNKVMLAVGAVLAVVIIVVVSFAVYSTQTGVEDVEDPEMETMNDPVQIGTILAYTGDLANFGPPMKKGVDLAVTQINEAGGILDTSVEAVHRDSGTNPQIAIESARNLVNVEGVHTVVGALSSGITQAVAESVTTPNQVVLVSPASTSPALTVMQDNDFVFRTTVSDAAQGAVLGKLARELGYDTASALYINNAYGEGLARVFQESFESNGGDVVELVPQESGQATYVSELERATEEGSDVLVAMSYPESAGVYLREAIEGSFADTFLFVDGTKNQDMFDTLGATNFNGAFGTAPGTPESDASTIFAQMYEAQYGELPSNPFIGETFDAFVILAFAIEKAGVNEGPAIRDAMREVANAPGVKVGPGDIAKALELIRSGQDIDYEGVAGSQTFDANGDVSNSIEIWNIENGQITSTGRFENP